MDDWTSVVSGLGGAVIGALAGYLGTHQAQRNALAVARLARVQNREDQAVAALAGFFGELQHHVLSVPGGSRPGMASEERAALKAARQLWDEELQERIGPARVAIGAIRDSNVRHKLNESLDVLQEWNGGLLYAFHDRSRVWVLGQVVSYAVECIGSWQREEELPEPNHGFEVARDSVAIYTEEREATINGREEDR